MSEKERSAAETDDERRRRRIRGQVKIIQEAFEPGQVGFDTQEPGNNDPADFRYLYNTEHVLVRDQEIPRLQSALLDRDLREEWGLADDEIGGPVDGLIEGVTLYKLPDGSPELPDVLATLDGLLGAGVVTPDHVLYVTGGRGGGGSCPATEPEPPARMDPVPPKSTDGVFDGSGVLVSVVDTGWYPDAAGYAESPWLASDVSGDVEIIDPNVIHPYGGHGTFVAGVVRCIAPHAEVRVEGFHRNGGAMFESKMVKQLGQALRLGPDVISLSAGTWTRNDHRLLTFQVFWETQLRQLKGTVLVAAAGNDHQRIPFWPAAFPWSVSVGAVDANGDRSTFSNFGSWVDVYTLGVDIINAFPKGTYHYSEPPNEGRTEKFHGLARWSGTSFSTPILSGMIAARMSGRGENARQAADGLLRHARGQAKRGVGAWLEPDRESYRSP